MGSLNSSHGQLDKDEKAQHLKESPDASSGAKTLPTGTSGKVNIPTQQVVPQPKVRLDLRVETK
jgi:hypothetical protein